jgi:cell division protein FtsB
MAPRSALTSKLTSNKLTSQKSARPPWLRLVRLVGLGLGLLLAAYVFILGESGILSLADRRARLERETARLARLQAETDSLRLVLERLAGDLEFIEKVAREKHGMIKPGERLYQVVEKKAIDE